MRVRLTPAAKADIEEAHGWYAEHGALLARRFKAALRIEIGAIGERPLSFQQVHGDVRRAVLRRFPYLLLFRVVESQVVVLARFHAKRDPTVWQRRVDD